MLAALHIIANFTAILVLVLSIGGLLWVGRCLRAWLEGGAPALESITRRPVKVLEFEIYAGAFLLSAVAFGLSFEPSMLSFSDGFRVHMSVEAWLAVLLPMSLMLCWRVMHPAMRIRSPWRVIFSAMSIAIVLEVSKWTH